MEKQKTAFLTGINGQDGSYLAEQLLEKGYKVYGLYRRSASPHFENIFHIKDKLNLICGDLTDPTSINDIFSSLHFNEVYNLAAQSFVGASFSQPHLTFNIDAIGVLNLLEAIRKYSPDTRFYQASTSEMFGSNAQAMFPHGQLSVYETDWKYQDENTPFKPESPYAVAKVAAHHMCQLYRRAYNLHISCGILFNHESERRGIEFVTRKITDYVGKVISGKTDEKLKLGNLEASRDWGHAEDYCIDYDVPLLTPNGWKFRNELNVGDEVINFNPTSDSLEVDKINEIFDTTSNGDRYVFEGRGVYLKCTENHRIYYQQKSKQSKGGWSKWKVNTAKEMFDKFQNLSLRAKYDYRFPHFTNSNVKDINISDDKIYLIGALVAEGHLKSSYANGNVVSLSQSYIVNEKIHQKITDVIKNLNLVCRLRNRNDGVTEWIFDSDSSREILSWFDSSNVHILPRNVYSYSQRQARILFDSMMDCDGCWGSMSYCSKRYLLAVDFQSIAHLAGFRTSSVTKRDNCYIVGIIVKNKPYTYVQSINLEKTEDYNVWCISTNNSTIITRSNESIFISGNCNGMWLMLQQDVSDDYVLSTGVTHTIRDFLDEAFGCAALDWKNYVVQDPQFMRPSEVPFLRGLHGKAKEKLGWEPKIDFKTLVHRMVDNDIRIHSEK